MKKKFVFIPILFFPLLLSSCSFSYIIDINPVAKVEIEDSTTYYAYGDIYSERQELSVLVTYKSNSRKPEYISVSDTTVSLFVDDVEQDYTSAIANQGGAGKLTVYVTYNNVKSNTLTYDLLNEHIYVEQITIDGVNNANTFEETTLTLTISPSNYTHKVDVYASDASMVSIVRNDNVLKITGKKPGEVDIIASSIGANGSEIKATHHMTFVAETDMLTAKQTYGIFVVDRDHLASQGIALAVFGGMSK